MKYGTYSLTLGSNVNFEPQLLRGPYSFISRGHSIIFINCISILCAFRIMMTSSKTDRLIKRLSKGKLTAIVTYAGHLCYKQIIQRDGQQIK